MSKVDYWGDSKLTLFKMDLHIDFVEFLEQLIKMNQMLQESLVMQ
jgi:hypothetical protein